SPPSRLPSSLWNVKWRNGVKEDDHAVEFTYLLEYSRRDNRLSTTMIIKSRERAFKVRTEQEIKEVTTMQDKEPFSDNEATTMHNKKPSSVQRLSCPQPLATSRAWGMGGK
ncbi:unnamed protein product, partial [Ilex paraguariensis]